jgi:hypothetical protein
MATKKKAGARSGRAPKAGEHKRRAAHEVTVEVPHGSRKSKVHSLVKQALEHKSVTDALDNKNLVVVRLETNGNSGDSGL